MCGSGLGEGLRGREQHQFVLVNSFITRGFFYLASEQLHFQFKGCQVYCINTVCQCHLYESPRMNGLIHTMVQSQGPLLVAQFVTRLTQEPEVLGLFLLPLIQGEQFDKKVVSYWRKYVNLVLFKVFPSTNCPYRRVKVTCFGKSVKFLQESFLHSPLIFCKIIHLMPLVN